ncbi:superoxide dismutase family protein [Brevundimonas lenta]|uniref:Cu-Zn family superoxide dismutase n=1 Tax=Brevundimonas lenta TaxID=424796 RepID=A0A7W6NQU5_9CAUL|nr:superoxide dismutase family protein [Brevundimonas lenta]MBB4083495.1 Cu-Zn family superoxide dismutase [Brevundimonas lenta]
MRIRLLAACLIAPLAAAAGAVAAQTAPPAAPPPAPVARTELHTAEGTDFGTVTAFSGPQGMLFRIEGRNWPAGWHSVHLHTVGKCEGPGFTSAGGHLNHEHASPHGLLNFSGGPDMGDLQNVWAAADGTANAEVYLAHAATEGVAVDLLAGDGVTFMVHAAGDDHVSQPIGGAGPRIACGVFEAPN